MTSRTPCIKDVDEFCCVCGDFDTNTELRSISELIKAQYLKYYGTPMSNLDKPWVPTSVCYACRLTLSKQDDKSIKKNVIIQPTIWHEPQDHDTDVTFAYVIQKDLTRRIRRILFTETCKVNTSQNRDYKV